MLRIYKIVFMIISVASVFADGSDGFVKQYLDFSSVGFYFDGNQIVTLGNNQKEVEKSGDQITIITDLLLINFGPIDGISSELLDIGWNNQDRIIYIEANSDLISTIDGLKIGKNKYDVIKALGLPHAEYDNVIRYQNTDFEVFGILFVIENEIVVKMISFAFV